jgi:hypothetical protein
VGGSTAREPSAVAQMRLVHVLARATGYAIPDREYRRLQRATAAQRSDFITTLEFKRDLLEVLAGKRPQGSATTAQMLYWVDLRERSLDRPTMDEVREKWSFTTIEMKSTIAAAMKAFNQLQDRQGRDVADWRRTRGFFDDDVRREAHRRQVQKKNQREQERREKTREAEKAAILSWRINGPEELKAQQRALKRWENKWIHPYDRHK